jgi:putative intracellular protease/amidase
MIALADTPGAGLARNPLAPAEGLFAKRPEGLEALPPELAQHPRYRILHKLGEGGMGAVYKAEHRLMGRVVALKVVNPHLLKDAVSTARFQQEVQAAARLKHPNIVTAHDAEQVGNCHLLVMEFVEGLTLARLVEAEGPLPIGRACELLRQAALGLQHAHDQGMVHRDVKPQNLMLTFHSQVKILDFGLARLAGGLAGDQALTLAGEIIGTPDYLAPEQIRDSRCVDHRADLYALGCTAYFLLTGQTPYADHALLEKLFAHGEKEPVPVEQVRPELPKALGNVVRKLMAKQPEDRYQSGAEAAEALAAFVSVAGTDRQEEPAPPSPVADAPGSLLVADFPAQPDPPAGTPLLPETAPRSRRGLVAALLLGVLVAAAFAVARNRPAHEQAKQDAAGEDGPDQQGTRTRPRVLFLLASRRPALDEYAPIREVLEAEGVEVVVASATGAVVRDGGKEVKPDLRLGAVQASDYDALVIGGGPGVEEYIGMSKEAVPTRRLIAELMRAYKPVAAIGRGPAVLAALNLMRDKPVTCAAAVKEQVLMQGGILKDKPVVVVEPAKGHGPIITARDAAAAAELARILLKLLRQPAQQAPAS